MPAIAKHPDFLSALKKSGLFTPEDVRECEESYGNDPELARALVKEGALTQYQADRLSAGKWRGLVRGKYNVLDRIGSGGLSTVFLADHRFIRKQVALKVIRPDEATDEACLARLYREARLLAQLDHPNLVRIYDIEHIGDEHFLVMEYVRGENLRDVVKDNGPLSVAEATRCIYEAAVGLQHVHDRGLLHRDIKPGNILRDENGQIKLIDFSLSRQTSDRTDQITVRYCRDAFLGSADYAAPEQFRDSQSIDHRADLYGLGATLYFLLTGRPPFPAEEFADKRRAHESKPLTSVRVLRPEVPEALARVLTKMLAKKPADRFQSAAEFAEALAPWLRTGSREFNLDAGPAMPRCTPCGDGITTPAWEVTLDRQQSLPVIWTPPPVANLFSDRPTGTGAVANPLATPSALPAGVPMSRIEAAIELPQQGNRWRRWCGVTLSTMLGAVAALSAWYWLS